MFQVARAVTDVVPPALHDTPALSLKVAQQLLDVTLHPAQRAYSVGSAFGATNVPRPSTTTTAPSFRSALTALVAVILATP